jgi:hypothetical protein
MRLRDTLGFSTPEYAKRFAKALRHAVNLCGGKPSSFLRQRQGYGVSGVGRRIWAGACRNTLPAFLPKYRRIGPCHAEYRLPPSALSLQDSRSL